VWEARTTKQLSDYTYDVDVWRGWEGYALRYGVHTIVVRTDEVLVDFICNVDGTLS
jgi:hypothetical protein